ncbi:unnamed protein product, partial [Pocillopora meandrina]
ESSDEERSKPVDLDMCAKEVNQMHDDCIQRPVVMASCDGDSISEPEPFQVIPTYYPGEEPPQEENVEQKAEAQEEHTSSRMGNTMFVRCLCAYALMPVANECHCC